MRLAVKDAKRPMYFLQPKNGLSLSPTKVLFSDEVDQFFRVQASIFPPAPVDTVCANHDPSCWDDETNDVKPVGKQAHSNFIGDKGQVELWGPSVVEFINRYPKP